MIRVKYFEASSEGRISNLCKQDRAVINVCMLNANWGLFLFIAPWRLVVSDGAWMS